MLKQRLILGPVMIGLFLLMIYADHWVGAVNLAGTPFEPFLFGIDQLPPGIVLAVVILVLIGLVASELCSMARAKQIPADRLTMIGGAVVGCLLVYLMPGDLQPAALMGVFVTTFTIILLASMWRFSWSKKTDGALLVGGLSLFSLTYLGVMPGFLLMIRQSHSAWLVAAIVLVTKMCDIGAYFTGRAIGRHKLILWLSPGKTWEGLIGGLALSGGVCVGLLWLVTNAGAAYWESVGLAKDYHWLTGVSWWSAAGAGALFGAIGQCGDLLASLLKRDAGIKDSGQSVPGFGGFLDVVDSPIVVAPVAYWLLQLGL